jgi:hypothetical protein
MTMREILPLLLMLALMIAAFLVAYLCFGVTPIMARRTSGSPKPSGTASQLYGIKLSCNGIVLGVTRSGPGGLEKQIRTRLSRASSTRLVRKKCAREMEFGLMARKAAAARRVTWQDHSTVTFRGVSSTTRVATCLFAGVMVIASTLISTNAVPRMVRGASASPPSKYPSNTATAGFTYA